MSDHPLDLTLQQFLAAQLSGRVIFLPSADMAALSAIDIGDVAEMTMADITDPGKFQQIRLKTKKKKSTFTLRVLETFIKYYYEVLGYTTTQYLKMNLGFILQLHSSTLDEDLSLTCTEIEAGEFVIQIT